VPFAGAEILTLRISSIDNPRSQAFVLTVLAEPQDGDLEEIGRVTPFPPDRAGTFTIVIPERVRSAFAKGRGQRAVVIRIDPASEEVGLESPLRVLVHSVLVRRPATPSPRTWRGAIGRTCGRPARVSGKVVGRTDRRRADVGTRVEDQS
jgi:hypothetical protein